MSTIYHHSDWVEMNESEFKISRVSLPKEGNKDYYMLVEESNNISQEYERIQRRLFLLSVPRFFLFGFRMKLRVIGEDLQALTKKCWLWDSNVRKFCTRPKYLFPENGENRVAFLHFTEEIRERARFVQGFMLQGMENYNKRFSEFENRRNYLIAISGWILTLLGILASLIGLI